jgi:hypothetical protein
MLYCRGCGKKFEKAYESSMSFCLSCKYPNYNEITVAKIKKETIIESVILGTFVGSILTGLFFFSVGVLGW